MLDEHVAEESAPDDLESVLATAARNMQASKSGGERETLDLIVSGALETVPGAAHAGVLLLRNDSTIVASTPSSTPIGELDQLQTEYRQGPCVTALWDEHTVVVADMSAESERWPLFAPRAVEYGVGSMLSFQLFARGNTLGALNLYAREPNSFGEEARNLGGLFASHAAIALGEAQHVAQLHQALASRDLIGQAKGILMERFQVDPARAFGLLVESSQQTNMKVVEVARWLTRETSQPE